MKKIVFILSTCLTIFIISEVFLRLIGYSPFDPSSNRLRTTFKPFNPFIGHPDLGYFQMPGHYNITLNDSLTFSTTHNLDSLRITGEPSHAIWNISIGLFGCSFTYGEGVDDTGTFAWCLQQSLPENRVINYGVIGYGTIHALIQLRQLERKNNLPDVVVINYASFHDERNLLPAYWRKNLIPVSGNYSNEFLETVSFPQGFVANDSVATHLIPLREIYHGLPFIRYSSLFNLLDNALNRILYKEAEGIQLSEKILLDIKKICIRNNKRLVITGIANDQRTREMLSFCKEHEMETAFIAVNLEDRKFTNYPYDSHPNTRAHHIYCSRILSKLKRD